MKMVSGSIPPRIGSVHYLNAAPLTFGLEDRIRFTTPAQLAVLLRREELDAALVSVSEVLLTDRYDILDGLAIAALGEVYSVLLAHKKPLAGVREVFCDPASLTSVNLLKVLLAERGLRPVFRPLESYETAVDRDFVLLIGDRAIDFQRTAHPHQIFDLGREWFALTQLPFVFAVWALRRGGDRPALCRTLRAAGANGLRQLDRIIRDRTEYDLAFRQVYFERHIRYQLNGDEKLGLARFCELLRKHRLGDVFAPRYIA
jgi:chorismate dehydratase